MKAVLYARVSSKEQEEEGYSVPAQLKLLKEYAQKHNFKIVQEFIDVETAKRAGRTNFNQMIEFFQSNKNVRFLLCEKTDRLYRNFKDYVNLEEFDLTIHLVKENEILSKESKSHQKFIHGIKVLMAKNYIDNLSEETKKGMLQKAHEGYYPSFAPLGYINVEKNINGRKIKTINIDKSRSYIIKKIFELYANRNHSLQQITEFANQEGLRSRRGYKIHKSTVHKIIRDPIYYGNFTWRGELCKGKHQPIISKELFDLVQERLDSFNRPKQIKKHKFAFTGLLTCGMCGCAITSEIKKEKYIYYHCTSYKGKCGNKAIREEKLIQKMGELVNKIQIDNNIIDWAREALNLNHQDEKEYHNHQYKLLQEQYDKLQRRIDKIYIDKLDEIVTSKFYQKMTNQWKEELEKLLKQIEKHKKANVNYFEQGIKIIELSQKLYSTYLKRNNEGKREILNIILSNCSLNAGNLYPIYRKPFNFLAKGLTRSVWLPG